MESEIVKTVVQGGVLGALCFYLIFSFGKKVDRLSDLISSLPEKMADTLSRVIHR